MASRELIVERVAALTTEDLNAIERFLDRLSAAGNDPIRRAFIRASLLPPEDLSTEDRAAIDDALTDDIYFSRDDLNRALEGGI